MSVTDFAIDSINDKYFLSIFPKPAYVMRYVVCEMNAPIVIIIRRTNAIVVQNPGGTTGTE